MYILCIVRKAY